MATESWSLFLRTADQQVVEVDKLGEMSFVVPPLPQGRYRARVSFVCPNSGYTTTQHCLEILGDGMRRFVTTASNQSDQWALAAVSHGPGYHSEELWVYFDAPPGTLKFRVKRNSVIVMTQSVLANFGVGMEFERLAPAQSQPSTAAESWTMYVRTMDQQVPESNKLGEMTFVVPAVLPQGRYRARVDFVCPDSGYSTSQHCLEVLGDGLRRFVTTATSVSDQWAIAATSHGPGYHSEGTWLYFDGPPTSLRFRVRRMTVNPSVVFYLSTMDNFAISLHFERLDPGANQVSSVLKI